MNTFDDFIDLAYSIQDKELFADFMTGVTTPAERAELVRRVKITEQLLDGVPQQKIARDLGVGVATVTRGSKELAQGRFKVLKENR